MRFAFLFSSHFYFVFFILIQTKNHMDTECICSHTNTHKIQETHSNWKSFLSQATLPAILALFSSNYFYNFCRSFDEKEIH